MTPGADTFTTDTRLWQEAWAILAQAWRPPITPAQCQALRECLAEDLSSLGQELGMGLDTRVLASTLATQQDQALLVGYARLFLTPPYAAHLDLGNDVDGQQMGPYAQSMAQTLAELGLQLTEDRHEHPDYLPVMLEAALHLENERAADTQRLSHLQQLAKGLQSLQQSLAEHADDSAWQQLAALTQALVQQRLQRLGGSSSAEDRPNAADLRRKQRAALTSQVQQAHHDQVIPDLTAIRARQAGIPPEAMLEMIAKLEAQGLDASHLRGQLPGEGWTSLIPPEAKQGRTSQAKTPGRPDSSASKT